MGYRYLKDYQKDDGNKGTMFCEKEDADYILLPMKEYNGFKKSLRIIHDRALQQIDKSKADVNGFRLLRAGKSYYKQGNGMVYLVTKETPYSIKMELGDAWFLIEQKLRELYYWIDEFNLKDFAPIDDDTPFYASFDTQLTHSDFPKLIEQMESKEYRQYDFYLSNNEKGQALKKLINKYGGSMIIGIAKVSANQAQGVYEVSYWCTHPF